jgi:hypothetical protein
MQNKNIISTNDEVQKHGYCERYFNDGDFFFHSYVVNGDEQGFVNVRNKIYIYYAR